MRSGGLNLVSGRDRLLPSRRGGSHARGADQPVRPDRGPTLRLAGRAQAARHPGDRGLRRDRRGRELRGHRAVRPLQAGLAATLPRAAGRHSLARHLPPGADADRPGALRALLPRLGTLGVPAGHDRTAADRDRRQDGAGLVRPPERPLAFAPGQRVRGRARAGAGAAGGRGEEGRAFRIARSARRPGPARLPGQPGCTEIAGQITDRGGDYLLALKGNQTKAHAEVRRWFEANAFSLGGSLRPCCDAFEDGHGRRGRRRVFACTELEPLATVQRWRGLTAVLAIENIRGINGSGKVTAQIRYYLSSSKLPPAQLASAIRSHWAIENGLHWVLDVGFNEDASRVRERTAARNLALLRKVALNFARANTTLKASLKGKRKSAAWDNAFMATLIAG